MQPVRCATCIQPGLRDVFELRGGQLQRRPARDQQGRAPAVAASRVSYERGHGDGLPLQPEARPGTRLTSKLENRNEKIARNLPRWKIETRKSASTFFLVLHKC